MQITLTVVVVVVVVVVVHSTSFSVVRLRPKGFNICIHTLFNIFEFGKLNASGDPVE